MHAILGHFSFKQLDLAKRFTVGNAGGLNVYLILVEFRLSFVDNQSSMQPHTFLECYPLGGVLYDGP
jgi:hypothetical protein